MFRRPRRSRERLLLPGETIGRRRFLQAGLAGGLLLAGVTWFSWREEDLQGAGGPFAVLTPLEGAVLLAIARRVVPSGPPFPPPETVRVAERIDAFLAMSHVGVQRDVKALISLLDSALVGLALDGSPVRFRTASPARQDARLQAWATSRVGLRRTGFRALRRLVCSAYYSSPATWGALGYPGPPVLAAPPPPEPRGAPVDRPRPPRRPPGAEPADRRSPPGVAPGGRDG